MRQIFIRSREDGCVRAFVYSVLGDHRVVETKFARTSNPSDIAFLNDAVMFGRTTSKHEDLSKEQAQKRLDFWRRSAEARGYVNEQLIETR